MPSRRSSATASRSTSHGSSTRSTRSSGSGAAVPIALLENLGFFSERCFGVHLSCMDFESDLPILQRHESFTYVHCPSGGGAGGSNGCQPFPELLAAGIEHCAGERHAFERLRREPEARRAQRAGTLLHAARCERRADEDADDLGCRRCGDGERGARTRSGGPRTDQGRREGRSVQHRRCGPARRWRCNAAGAAQQPPVRERPLRSARRDRRQSPAHGRAVPGRRHRADPARAEARRCRSYGSSCARRTGSASRQASRRGGRSP